jgi:hypothetical protein
MKRDRQTNLSVAARILGKKGGPARAKSLTAGRRKDIASQGGKAKARKKERKAKP